MNKHFENVGKLMTLSWTGCLYSILSHSLVVVQWLSAFASLALSVYAMYILRKHHKSRTLVIK